MIWSIQKVDIKVNRVEVTEKIVEIIKAVTKDPHINVMSSQQNCPTWDSLAYLVIAEEIENRFQVPISSVNINSLGSVIEIVEVILKSQDHKND